MKTTLLGFVLIAGLSAQVVTINSSDNGAVSLGKINSNFTYVDLTFTAPLIRAVNAISCRAATGSVSGCLSAANWTTFNSKEEVLSFTSPLSRSTNTISFGTKSANTVLAGPTTGSAAAPAFRALVAADFPSVATLCPTCVVSSSPGAGIAHFAGSTQTVTSSAVSLTADVSGLLPTANQAAAGLVRPCEVVVGGVGSSSPVLANDDDTPAICDNATGATMTITAVACYANAGTPTVTPIITGGGATTILSGACTCGTASYGACTLNGTPTQTNGQTIDANITAAGGTATYIVMRIVRTL